MQNHCNPPRKINESSRSETNKPVRETAYAASRTLSYAICLCRTCAPSRTAQAWMMWVPPQSKFHHLEKKTWLSWRVTSGTRSYRSILFNANAILWLFGGFASKIDPDWSLSWWDRIKTQLLSFNWISQMDALVLFFKLWDVSRYGGYGNATNGFS